MTPGARLLSVVEIIDSVFKNKIDNNYVIANNIKRWIEIGLDEYLYSNNLVIIEWGNMIEEILPDNIIRIYFEHIDLNKRKVFSNYEYFSY